MTEYTKHISEPWFTLIKLGIKKCEGRIKNDDFSKMEKGDIIIFTNGVFGSIRSYSVKITSIHTYNTFKEYLINETLEKCLPGIDTIEQGLSVYYKYYTKADEDKYNIVAVRLCVI
jgi:ASC-1-like (ASCH) protein